MSGGTRQTFNPGLNRVTLGHFGGLPDGMAGSLAHEWLATWSIAPRMRAELGTPDLPPIPAARKRDIARLCLQRLPRRTQGLPSLLRSSVGELHARKMRVCSRYPEALEERLSRGDPRAAAFADRLGLALAALVATLKLAPAESRAAQPDWPETHWNRWGQVNDIVLGGGVLSGTLGQHLASTASEWLPRLGVEGVRLHLFAQPRLLMLHGAARQYREGPVLVLDAGHTAVKRAYAEVSAGEVREVRPAPLLPTPYEVSDGHRLLDFLAGAMLETLSAQERAEQVAVSLSAHLDGAGNVSPATAASSFYGSLAGLDLEAGLRERLDGRLGPSCQVRVIHEGQAAVHGLPGMDAALLLGTSVGGALRGRGER